MLVAVLVAILALLAAAAIVVVVLMVRSRRSGRQVRASRDPVRSVNNVGFGSSASAGGRSSRGRHATVAAAPRTTTGRPSEALRSRFVAVGVLAAAVFGSLTAKIWSMQVLASEDYKKKAVQNKYTTVHTPAPRGMIYDADGTVLVKNRTVLTVLADKSVADDHDVMQRLSTVLGIPLPVVRMRIQDSSSGAQSQRVVSADASQRDAAFIAEHSDAFTGVSVQERTMREYPYAALAAHVLGYTGTVSEDELATAPSNRNIELGDTVGKSGIEAYYDNVLAGEHGSRRVMIDSHGSVVEIESETPPTRGNDIYLTIKAPVQYVAETQLAQLIAPKGIIGEGKGVGGAVVAMNVEDGSIIAMASYPTFDPSVFTGGVAQDVWDLYSTAESYYPLLNRAIAGTYPAASTYKAYTSLAGLKHGFADGSREWDCQGSWDGFNSGDWQNCWLLTGHGNINLHDGIVVSCDVVFYEIAKDFFYAGKTQGGTLSDTALQEEIAQFGFGSRTGIDLSGEEAGRIPTPEWKAQHWIDVPAEGAWHGGDLTNLVIGQGDVLITPLQNAVGYAAVATGKLMKPHLLKEVRNASGETAVKASAEQVGTPDVEQKNYEIVRSALGEVSLSDSKITYALSEYGIDVKDIGSKTGTGEVAGKGDVAWYCCYYPLDNPKYVVATCIEQGGTGALVAGPVGANVLGAVVAAERGDLTEVAPVAGSSGKSVEFKADNSARTD